MAGDSNFPEVLPGPEAELVDLEAQDALRMEALNHEATYFSSNRDPVEPQRATTIVQGDTDDMVTVGPLRWQSRTHTV